MKVYNNKYIIGWMLLLLSTQSSFAQKGINSVYSAYGLGDYFMLDNNGYSGMGGVGVALKSVRSVNTLNPASFAGIPKDRFMLDLNFGGSSIQYLNEKQRSDAGDFSIRKVGVGVQLLKNLGTVFGFQRFSQVEYYTITQKNIQGTDSYLSDAIEGNGGLNNVYFGNSYAINKNLSVGVTAGFIFGSVNKNEKMFISSEDLLQVETNTYYNKATINAGAQYSFKTKKYKWTLGGYYQPQVTMNTEEDNNVKDGAGNILSSKPAVSGTFKYPARYGAGIALQRERFIVSADYLCDTWSQTGYRGNNFIATDAESFSLGASYTLTRKSIWGNSEGITLSAGINRQLSYLIIDGEQIATNSISIGVNFPSRNMFNNYSAIFRFGTRGRPVFPLVREKFIEFGANISLSGFLYKGGRKYE